MYDTVLVATGGGEEDEAVLDHAITIASDHDATVHALYVVDRRVYATAFDEGPSAKKSELREAGEAALGTVADRAAAADLDVETELRDGDPEKVVAAHADDVDADLVVVGSHDKTPREKVQGLGSVSESVVKSTTRPVLVVGVDADRRADAAAGAETSPADDA